jgi:hypothetical protein
LFEVRGGEVVVRWWERGARVVVVIVRAYGEELGTMSLRVGVCDGEVVEVFGGRYISARG